MKTWACSCLLMLFALSVSAQSKKDIKNNKVKSITENITVVENGKTSNYKSQYTVYDKGGNVIERTEFMPDGTVKKKETFVFDKSGNKIEESLVEGKTAPDNGKEAKNYKKTSKYNVNNDKVEEIEYDGTGKIVKKTAMNYSTNGNKTLEVEYDGAGKISKKIIYTYNSKGLRVDRKEYEGDTMTEEKKFDYQYY